MDKSATEKTDDVVKEKTPSQAIVWIGVTAAVVIIAGCVTAVLIIHPHHFLR